MISDQTLSKNKSFKYKLFSPVQFANRFRYQFDLECSFFPQSIQLFLPHLC